MQRSNLQNKQFMTEKRYFALAPRKINSILVYDFIVFEISIFKE